jgi:Leucine-rich repeat (LRR) protein
MQALLGVPWFDLRRQDTCKTPMTSPTPEAVASPPKSRLFARALFGTLFVLLLIVSLQALKPYGWKIHNPWDPLQHAVASIEGMGGIIKTKGSSDGRTLYYVTLNSRYYGGNEGLAYLADLPDLDGVYIENSTLTDAGMPMLGKLEQLDELSLACPSVTDAGLKSLTGLQKVRWLNLTGVKMGDEGLESVCGLKNLTKLTLTGTQVSDKGLERLADLKELRQLWLDFTLITDDGVEHLMKLDKLERLWVDSTKVSESGAKRLSDAREGLEVVHSTPTRWSK